MELKMILYVVANRTEAVFYQEGIRVPFHFSERMKNKKGRRRESDLVSDRPGRVSSPIAQGSLRHALENHLQHHELAASAFARAIAHRLEARRRDGLYDSLILVAEPRFLGVLRAELPPSVSERVLHEVQHEYVRKSDTEIRSQILSAISKDVPPESLMVSGY